MKVLADGDSLQAEIRGLLARRARAEKARAAPDAPRWELLFVAARPLPLPMGSVLVLVEEGPDAADARMEELAEAGDLAVTRDLPLAERLAARGLRVLNDRGDVWTTENVAERRSLRDRAAELRAMGLAPESSRARGWGQKEFKAFADTLDRELARALKRTP